VLAHILDFPFLADMIRFGSIDYSRLVTTDFSMKNSILANSVEQLGDDGRNRGESAFSRLAPSRRVRRRVEQKSSRNEE
ncbi:hypothetical protein PFISCL1PPCAC_9656, partial [Pristionchus fissidentatus]